MRAAALRASARAYRPRSPPRAHFADATSRKPVSTISALSTDERNIVAFLNEVNTHYNLGNTIRVAGGWVRNKLLGKAGGDMDIALDKMTGATFCQHLRDYQIARGLEQRRISVIRANPAQSKHLETATTTIFNHTLDFVHLRSEKYDTDSRIPHVVFGTPKEDAERRDFTVNALFYNAASTLVEDFTEHGLEDLRARVLRTPLEPLRTLLDDPLRAVRCVRFVGQLSFEPVKELVDALQDPNVKEALRAKVSRERIGVELGKMCLSPSAFRAFELLADTGLASIVYDVGFTAWKEGIDSLRHISSYSSEQREAVMHAAFLWPAYQQQQLRQDDIVQFFLRSLRGSKRRGESVAAVLASTRAALSLLASATARSRENAGAWLRASPEAWKACIMLAARDMEPAKVNHIITELNAFDPAAVRAVRPLLNGNEIADLLNLPIGPQRGAAAQALMRWQLANPRAGREEAQAWLQQRRFYSTLAFSSPPSAPQSPMPPSLSSQRRSYQMGQLDESDVGHDPGALFSRWYAEAAIHSPPPLEPNAMSLCTTSRSGQPSCRIVLLRDFDQEHVAFTFYGNGNTRKGSEMSENPRVALVFYWPTLERQVRVEGAVERVPKEQSTAVFATRPRESQIGSWASPTGKQLGNRAELEAQVRAVEEQQKGSTTIDPPEHWAGWRIQAEAVEFFQGRPGRLHDRFVFHRTDAKSWTRERIAP